TGAPFSQRADGIHNFHSTHICVVAPATASFPGTSCPRQEPPNGTTHDGCDVDASGIVPSGGGGRGAAGETIAHWECVGLPHGRRADRAVRRRFRLFRI